MSKFRPVVFPSREKGGVAPKYPWKKWISTTGHILTRGKDYTCETECLINYAYVKARKLSKVSKRTIYLMVLKLDDNHIYIREKKSNARLEEEEVRIKEQFEASKALLRKSKRKVS